MKNFANIVIVVLFVALLAGGWYALKHPKTVVRIERHTDTVTIRDTVIVPVPVPERVYITRVDTLWITVRDSIVVSATLPIERKEYRSEEYFAVIEGFRPELVSMTLYPKTKIVTHTEVRTITQRDRFGIGVHVGYGLAGDKLRPYVGIGVQYNLISW